MGRKLLRSQNQATNRWGLSGLIIGLVVFWCLAAAVIWNGQSALPQKSLRELAQEKSPSTSQSSPTAYQSYNLVRTIKTRFGSSPQPDLTIVATVWKQGNELLFSFSSPPELKKFPLVRAIVGLPFSVQTLQVPMGTESSAELRRVVTDLIHPFFFDSTVDSQGVYKAKISDVRKSRIEKSKTAYLDLPYRDAKILESRHELLLDDHSQILEITGHDVIDLGQGDTLLHADLAYRIKANANLSAPVQIGQKWVEVVSSTPEGAHDNEAYSKSPSLGELIQDLRAGTRRTKHQRLKLFKQVSARIEGGDSIGTVPDFSGVVRRLPIEEQSTFIGALGASRNAEAQEFLKNEFKDPQTPAGEKELIANVWIASATPFAKSTVDYLMSVVATGPLSSPEVKAAALALGAQIRREDSGSQRAIIEKFLEDQVRALKEPGSKVVIIDAIGNSGSSYFTPVLKDYFSDSSETVRARAYFALRLIPGDEPVALLRSGLLDGSAVVRDSARAALKFR